VVWIKKLPYFSNSQIYAHLLHHLPWFIWLDSGGSQQGRYDILVADPYQTIVTWGECTEIQSLGNIQQTYIDPFTVLEQALNINVYQKTDLPFSGGAIGYWGYDLAWRLENLPVRYKKNMAWPDMAMGLYDWAIVVDHQLQETVFVGQAIYHSIEKIQAIYQQLQYRLNTYSSPSFPLQLQDTLRSVLSRDDYYSAIQKIKNYIREGDCYQVNFAHRFSAIATGDAYSSYLQLRQQSPAPFGAFLRLPWGDILSNSPEQFLHINVKRQVNTYPIKGTRPRHVNTELDLILAQELLRSEKDRAENVMIVDLLRNDLSKTCDQIKVPILCELHHFATVHHLISEISAELKPNQSALSVFKHCFPGGSITGAPKIRAMQIIEVLESHRRGVYCGSIGYVGFDGQLNSNIAIRTACYQAGTLVLWAGGGIVADSLPEQEYEETYVKMAAWSRLFGVKVD
jgi:para-aminobenzoate synthetase component I